MAFPESLGFQAENSSAFSAINFICLESYSIVLFPDAVSKDYPSFYIDWDPPPPAVGRTCT